MKSSLIILTLNEIEGAIALFDKIPFLAVDECFVIDGGSTDGTVEFFKEKGIRVIPQEIKGRGEAFRIAAREAKGNHLVFFSPDGNEDPKDIPRLLDLLDQGYDMAIASRFLPDSRYEEDGKLFPFRKWANQFFTLLVHLIWGANISDTINGYRAIKKSKFKELNVDAHGFVIEFQMSIRAAKLGHKLAEIPTIEGDRIGGKSTAKSIPTGLKALGILWHEIRPGNGFLTK
jgi:glycosyltransferase involved in cell wall biosynthesis